MVQPSLRPRVQGDESCGGQRQPRAINRVITSAGPDTRTVTRIVSMLEVVARSRCRCIILDETEAGD